MPGIPIDQPWSPLFAEIAVEALAPGDRLGLPPVDDVLGAMEDRFGSRQPALKLCWASGAEVVAALAVPPPWSGTATLSIAPGCARATVREDGRGGFSSVELAGAPVRVAARVMRGGRYLTDERYASAEVSFQPGQVVLWLPDGCCASYVFGDARSWAVADPGDPWGWEEQGAPGDPAAYIDFLERLGLPLAAVVEGAGQGPYAGLGVDLVVHREQDLGPFLADQRPALSEALRQVDPAVLTAPQRRWRSYLLDYYAGAPPLGPTAGKAQLVVPPGVVEVSIAGRTVFWRDPEEWKAARGEERTMSSTVEVDVPAGEGVLIRTVSLAFYASDRTWVSEPAEAWSVLLPGHRYEVDPAGLRVTPDEVCGRAEGEPGELVTRQRAGDELLFRAEGWPRSVAVRPVERGAYAVEMREDGAERVRFEPDGCPEGGAIRP